MQNPDTSPRPVRIAPTGLTQPLSPGQQQFNDLMQAIEVQRQRLAEWNEALHKVQQRHAQEIVPLNDAYGDRHADLVQWLDQRADDKALSRADQGFLRELICDMADALLHTRHAKAMTAIHNRNRPLDPEPETPAARAAPAMLPDSEPQDALSLDDIQAQIDAQMAEQAAQREQARRAHQSARRKPTAPQAQARAEEAHASQSIREVYRKLVSALHPDREPDAAERLRKTGLMQRVNQAYDKDDLLSLLQLQLEIEQINTKALGSLADDRLRHYNKVLSDQLGELQQEVAMLEQRFRQHYGLSRQERVNPATLMKIFARHKQRLVDATQALVYQLRLLDEDASYFKPWLRQQRERAWDEGLG